MRAAIYCRLSRAAADGDPLDGSPGITRQREDCEALAARRGDTVAGVWVDDGVSAWDPRQTRPGYEAMLTAIAAGQVDVILVWDVDRLYRRPRELEDLLGLADRHGVRLANVTGEIDISGADGRLIARILVAVAAKSSDDTSRRLKRALRAKALAGDPPGGRVYGYAGGRLITAEAGVIRWMADQVLHGARAVDIARQLNARGVPTLRSGQWTGQRVTTILRSPRISGIRIVDGQPIGGRWTPILARPVQRRVVAVFDGRLPAGRRRRPLSGVLVCGRCGAEMVDTERAPGVVYRCTEKRRGCGRVSISAPAAERTVRDRLGDLQAATGPIVVRPAVKMGWQFDQERLVWPEGLSCTG